MEKRGYLGEFKRTEIECPKCKATGHVNNGGRTPTLTQAEDGSLNCMGLHGRVEK